MMHTGLLVSFFAIAAAAPAPLVRRVAPGSRGSCVPGGNQWQYDPLVDLMFQASDTSANTSPYWFVTGQGVSADFGAVSGKYGYWDAHEAAPPNTSEDAPMHGVLLKFDNSSIPSGGKFVAEIKQTICFGEDVFNPSWFMGHVGGWADDLPRGANFSISVGGKKIAFSLDPKQEPDIYHTKFCNPGSNVPNHKRCDGWAYSLQDVSGRQMLISTGINAQAYRLGSFPTSYTYQDFAITIEHTPQDDGHVPDVFFIHPTLTVDKK